MASAAARPLLRARVRVMVSKLPVSRHAAAYRRAVSVGEGPVPSRRPQADNFRTTFECVTPCPVIALRAMGGHRSLPYRDCAVFAWAAHGHHRRRPPTVTVCAAEATSVSGGT